MDEYAKTLIKATPQQQSSEDSRISCTPESVKIWNTKQKTANWLKMTEKKKMKIQMIKCINKLFA